MPSENETCVDNPQDAFEEQAREAYLVGRATAFDAVEEAIANIVIEVAGDSCATANQIKSMVIAMREEK